MTKLINHDPSEVRIVNLSEHLADRLRNYPNIIEITKADNDSPSNFYKVANLFETAIKEAIRQGYVKLKK